MLAGRPHDPTFVRAATSAFEFIRANANMETFSKLEAKHRRGHFPALAIGISHGNGQGFPKRLRTGVHVEMIRRLLENENIKRLCLYADGKLVSFSLPSIRLL